MSKFIDSSRFLDSFIVDKKLKRWFRILQYLEEKPKDFEDNIVKAVESSTRLLKQDLNTIQEYFETNLIISQSNGKIDCHLQNPLGYVTAKEQLLYKEPIFELVNQIFQGTYKTRKEWEQTLDVSPGEFYQIKKELNHILSHYEIFFNPAEKGLVGDEVNIRRFYFYFYYKMGTYPPNVALIRQRLHTIESKNILFSDWGLDTESFLQWQVIFNQRQRLGYYLPKPEHNLNIYQKLVSSLYQTPPNFLPVQEGATLFLLSIENKIYTSSFIYDRFLENFVTEPVREILSIYFPKFDQRSYAIGGYIYFMEQLFSGPSSYTLSISERKSIGNNLSPQGIKFLTDLYQNNKNINISKITISVEWNLKGSKLINTWIKKQFITTLSDLNIHIGSNNELLKQNNVDFSKVSIRNSIFKNGDISKIDICITEIPTKQEIIVACQFLKKELELDNQ